MMRVAFVALALATLSATSALAAGGEITCAQYTRNYTDKPPEDANEVRLRAYCKKNPKVPARVAMEKTFKL
jgi:hypothetical protein